MSLASAIGASESSASATRTALRRLRTWVRMFMALPFRGVVCGGEEVAVRYADRPGADSAIGPFEVGRLDTIMYSPGDPVSPRRQHRITLVQRRSRLLSPRSPASVAA